MTYLERAQSGERGADDGLTVGQWRMLAIAATLLATLMTGIVIGKESAAAWGGERTFTIRLQGGARDVGRVAEPIGGELAP